MECIKQAWKGVEREGDASLNLNIEVIFLHVNTSYEIFDLAET
jgi:hypothetical protein